MCTPSEPCNHCIATRLLEDKLSSQDFEYLKRLLLGEESTQKHSFTDETLLEYIPEYASLPPVVRDAFKHHENIKTLGELAEKSDNQILRMPNIGTATLQKIKEFLAEVRHQY